MTSAREIAESTTILRGLVGSTIHGLNVNDGVEDRDEMGVCVEPLPSAFGIGAPFENYVYRSAAEREGKQDARSRAGDLDLTVYSLRKFISLALKGNPTILGLLFVPASECVVREARGAQLQELAPFIVSRKAGAAYLGYLEAQRQRLVGERGQKNVNRPELVARYGYDVKYATHMLRLGYQGVELLETGKLTLPIAEPTRTYLREVRLGQFSLNDVLTEAGRLRVNLEELLNHDSTLPWQPDTQTVEGWMLDTYWEAWKVQRFEQDRKKWAAGAARKEAA